METGQKSRLRGNTEGTWSLFSRAEAQDHLYVSPILSFLIPDPVPRNREAVTPPQQRRQKFVRVEKMHKNV